MRRLTNRLLILLALALLALGAAAQFALIHVPVPPLAFVAAGAILALLLVIARLPLGARRPVVFLVTLALLGGVDRRARLFPVRHQAEHGQGLHQRRLRAEADRGGGRGGED